MKFNEIKPFLMAGFKIDSRPIIDGIFIKKEGDCINRYDEDGVVFDRWYIKTFFRIYEDPHFAREWELIDADANNLTHDQAMQLMKAGYKVKPCTYKYIHYAFINNVLHCKGENDKKYYTAHLFDTYKGFQLYDNEPIQQEPIPQEPPQEQPMEKFDFLEAIRQMIAGEKVTCDSLKHSQYFEMKDDVVVSNKGTLCNIVFKGALIRKWSIYKEPKVESCTLTINHSDGSKDEVPISKVGDNIFCIDNTYLRSKKVGIMVSPMVSA